MDWIVIIVASLVFAGVWWGMSKLGAHIFMIAFVALLAALIVFTSRSLLGIPL